MLVKIFVEGKADMRFLEDFINYHFGNGSISSDDFINVKGKDSLHLVKNQFIQNTDQGGINLLIFDTDSDIEQRRKDLENEKGALGIEFELFLFPNNSDIGELEDLLINLTVPKHHGIFECFTPFNACLKGKDDNYNVPDLKTQIFSYLSFQKLEAKEPDRNYLLDCWNLNDESSLPLKTFLANYFIAK